MFADAVPAEIYASGLVFVRVGAIVMLIPGLGEAAVPPRIRLAFALLLSFLLTPVVASTLPPIPATVGGLGAQVIQELLIGLTIGGILRIFLGALAVAGEVVSLQTTLSFAQIANPLQAQSSTALGAFLTLFGVVLIFSADLHHGFIAAIARSYSLFEPTRGIPVQDAASMAVRVVGDSFAVGIQMAAPVIVFSLIFNLATGLIGRVMPQFQIFFVATPLSVLLGLSIFTLSLGAVGLVFVDRYRGVIERFA